MALGWLLVHAGSLAIIHLGFEALRSRYAVDYTDASTTKTWVARGRRRHSIADYGGAGPQHLRTVEELIDAAASELDWWLEEDDAARRGDRPIFVGLDVDEAWRPPLHPGERPHWTQAGRKQG